jgi:Bacterial membrane protein YfhO
VAMLGLWSRRREKWLALVLVVIGLLLGNNIAPFADIVGHLPLFRIAINDRMIFAAAFGGAVLAALGIDVLLQQKRRRELAMLAGIAFVVLAVLCATAWHSMRASGLSDSFLAMRTAILLAPLALGSLIAVLEPRTIAIAGALLLLILLQRTIESAHFYPTLLASIFYPRIPLLDRLPQTDEPYRTVGYGLVFYPNMSAVYGVEDVRAYQAMTFAPLRSTFDLWCVVQPIWFNRVDDLTRPFLSMVNVRYAFAPAAAAVPEGWKKIGAQPGMQLFENTRVLPRAFVPRRVRVNAEWNLLGPEMMAENDFAERAWITIPGEPSREAANGSGDVEIVRRGMRRFRLRTSMQSPAWVVITESAWKGWRAYIDGKPTRIHRANHAFLAIFVPAGTHRVRLEYLPQSFVAGRAITCATGLILLMWWSRQAIVNRVRRHRASQSLRTREPHTDEQRTAHLSIAERALPPS